MSYRRTDIERVRKLVEALESHDLTVWWDQELAGGENWRARIEKALSEARTVVAVWSEESVGHTGGFVRDEATRALADRRLVPVRIDDVDSPLGFGEIQALDLTRWKRGGKHPAIEALVEAIRAKLEGRDAEIEPILRRGRIRKLASSFAIMAIVAGLGVAALDVFSNRSTLCAMSTSISDSCGAMGLGGRPERDERLAWAALPAGDCEALRQFVEDYPDGSYRTAAADLITAREVRSAEQWTPAERRLRLFVPSGDPAASEAAARDDAIARGNQRAARACEDFPDSRLATAEIEPDEWICRPEAGGTVCAVEGDAICSLELRQTVETEYCGAETGARQD